MSKRRILPIGWKNLAYEVAMQKALATGDTRFSGVSRRGTAEDIDSFIVASFQIGSNPLPHLRKMFRDFDWSYEHILGMIDNEAIKRNRKKIVETSDFIWFAFGVKSECLDFITARKKQSFCKPKKFYGPGILAELATRSETGRECAQQLKSFGVQEIPVD